MGRRAGRKDEGVEHGAHPDVETVAVRNREREGGTILFGTDVGYMTDYSTEEEYLKMAEAGMGFRDILASLTTVPAARHGRGQRLGRIATGFDADLAVLRSDPAQTVGAFADVVYVIRGGRIIHKPAE
jgi:imidazolonepropionase-like amidohydrolase